MAYNERRGKKGFGRGGGFRFERREPAPVKAGEEYDVTISEVSTRGDGIARIQNFVVFVPNVRKGDKVRIKIREVRERSAMGDVVSASLESEEPAEALSEETEK